MAARDSETEEVIREVFPDLDPWDWSSMDETATVMFGDGRGGAEREPSVMSICNSFDVIHEEPKEAFLKDAFQALTKICRVWHAHQLHGDVTRSPEGYRRLTGIDGGERIASSILIHSSAATSN